jgi:hypothetical protein
MNTKVTSPQSPEVKAHLDQAYAYYEKEELEQALLEGEAVLMNKLGNLFYNSSSLLLTS